MKRLFSCAHFQKKYYEYGRTPTSLLLLCCVFVSAFITFASLLFILWHILSNGIMYIKPSLFALEYNTTNVSLLPALVDTLVMTDLALSIAGPLGVFAAIYLVEYAKKENKLVRTVRLTADTLSGIPSIVYGLFGLLFFVTDLKWGYSLLAGGMTLAIMILPLIMRTTEEALKAIPDAYREGSFGLGAGKLRTCFKIILPPAIPGIMAGVILAVGRIVGETAALMYTAGTVAAVPNSLMSSGRTLAVHMYVLSSEGLYMNEAYATAVVLVVLVIFINSGSAYLAKQIGKG